MELLVVIAVIALLMAILLPALRKAREVARMVACGSNQRQVILGLLTYSHDNDYKLPPSPGKDETGGWHRPNDLNFSIRFWSKRAPLTDAEMASIKDGYHYAGRYLGTILKNSEVFNCPVSEIRDSAVWPPYGGVAGTYGEFYRPGRLNVPSWARLFRQAGMGYAVLATRHTSEILLWPSKTSNQTVAATDEPTDVVNATASNN